MAAHFYFPLPSVFSIGATCVVLRWALRKDLAGRVEDGSQPVKLSNEGRLAAWGIVGTGAILLSASGFGLDLGLPTCISAVIAVLAVTRVKGGAMVEIAKGVSWSVLPLVAGLFVLLESLNRAGALHSVGSVLEWCARMPRFAGSLAASFGIAGLSNRA